MSTLLNYEQAAALLGMTPGALRALVSRGGIPHLRLSDRVVRFDPAELAEWLRSRRVPARAIPSAADNVIELSRGDGR